MVPPLLDVPACPSSRHPCAMRSAGGARPDQLPDHWRRAGPTPESPGRRRIADVPGRGESCFIRRWFR